jgi:hypothetical protein
MNQIDTVQHFRTGRTRERLRDAEELLELNITVNRL